MPAKPNRLREKLRLNLAHYKQLLLQQEDEMREVLKSDPGRALRGMEADCCVVMAQISELQKLLNASRPYVIRIKSFVPKITDETIEAACYLLLSQAVHHFEAIFLLAADGRNIEICELIRAISEALDLAVLFLIEGQTHPNLKKWFDGEIISNDQAREAAHRFFNVGRSDLRPVNELKTGVYAALSKYSHMSFAALIESIDVYARDFDWHRVAGFHHTRNGGLPFAKEILIATIVTLKQFYLFQGDQEAVQQLSELHNSA
jgi:hypothetical protein